MPTIGTNADNVRDRVERGRSADVRGEASPLAKLTADDVATIRRLADLGVTYTAIADGFGVSRRQVGRIAAREAWAA